MSLVVCHAGHSFRYDCDNEECPTCEAGACIGKSRAAKSNPAPKPKASIPFSSVSDTERAA